MELNYAGFSLLSRALRFLFYNLYNMIYLILCIVSSTLIFLIFKYISLLKIPALPVIIVNYFVASSLGFMAGRDKAMLLLKEETSWLPLSLIIGILFIVMFFVIGRSSEVAGISVTSVASKLSVMIPIVFSLVIDPADDLTIVKVLGITLAMLAVFLTVYKKDKISFVQKIFIYPLVLFFGMGLVDSLVKFAQLRYINDDELPIFTAVLFLIAFFTGIIFLFIHPNKTEKRFSRASVLWGTFLGISNFGSIYFIIKALNYQSPEGMRIDSSVIFGVNNTGIVVLSVLAGYLIFREKLEIFNYAGILLALIAIILFAYA